MNIRPFPLSGSPRGGAAKCGSALGPDVTGHESLPHSLLRQQHSSNFPDLVLISGNQMTGEIPVCFLFHKLLRIDYGTVESENLPLRAFFLFSGKTTKHRKM